MSLTDVAPGEVAGRSSRHHGHGPEALTAGSRALFAAVSGFLLTSGISVVLWAVTPHSVGGPAQSLRAGVAAFAAGNAMSVTIGRAALTLPPLMVTIIAVGLLAAISGRGRAVPDDRTGELTFTAAGAAVYSAVVTVTGVVLGTPGAIAAEQWWRPFLLALVVVGTAVFFRGEAWRAFVLVRTPRWFPVAVRLGAAAAAGVVAAGALAVVLGLAGSFGSVGTVQTLAAPGPAAGFGMALLGVAYLPNAVLAGAGYVTGVGFHIGGGTYSPFGSSPVELPAVSLLAAAPDGREASRVGMVLLLVPVLVALLVGRAAVRRLDARRERLSAVVTAAVFAGVLVAVLAVLAGGGITGGQWASIGAPPLLLGMVTALIMGVFGAVVAGLARQPAAPSSEEMNADSDVTAAAAGPDAADEPDTELDDAVARDAGPHNTAGNRPEDDGADGADGAGAPAETGAVASTEEGAPAPTGEVAIADAGELAIADAEEAREADTAVAHPIADTDTADTNTADTDTDTADTDTADTDTRATTATTQTETVAATAPADRGAGAGAGATAGTTVPLARREDDVLVDSGEPLRSGAEPRHVG